MTVPELAQAFFKAYHNNEIYSINSFLTNEDKRKHACLNACGICSLSETCSELSTLDNEPDLTTFLRNAKPVYDYIKYNYPEYLL